MNMNLLDRKKAIPILIGDHKRFLIISGLAGPAKDIGFLTKESPNTFLFGGAMGGALPTSLGLALSRPKEKVLCVSGDGDILMSMGCLATIATTKPKNLIIICVDNASYLETGGQTSHTGLGVNLDIIAKGCGFPFTKTIVTEEELLEGKKALHDNCSGPVFILLKVSKSNPPKYSRNWNASEEKSKFRKNLIN